MCHISCYHLFFYTILWWPTKHIIKEYNCRYYILFTLLSLMSDDQTETLYVFNRYNLYSICVPVNNVLYLQKNNNIRIKLEPFCKAKYIKDNTFL